MRVSFKTIEEMCTAANELLAYRKSKLRLRVRKEGKRINIDRITPASKIILDTKNFNRNDMSVSCELYDITPTAAYYFFHGFNSSFTYTV